MPRKTVLCSAGLSHLLLYPNGDVYRCMADYNARRAPLFNATQGWQTIDRPFECPHDRCYAACDLDWAKKWVFEAGNPVPEILQPQSHAVNHAHGRPWADQTLDRPLANMVHIVWAPSLLCNYDCIYCGCAVGAHNIRKEFLSASPELDVGEWTRVWQGIAGQYDFGIVSITGGEPLLSRATLPVMKLVADRFSVSITTNLSTNVFGMVRDLPKAKGGRTGLKEVVASLHLTAKGFDRNVFLGRVLYLKNNGIPTTINFVGHPLQLFLADEYQQWCKDHDVPFVLSPWHGRDNDGYEAVYTEAERSYLDAVAPVNRTSETLIDFCSYRYELEMASPRISAGAGESVAIRGRIRNIGDGPWSNKGTDSAGAFALGARLYPAGEARKSLRDVTSPLPRAEVLPHEECDVEMEFGTQGLPRGVYTLKIGLVTGDQLWFENKGNEPGDRGPRTRPARVSRGRQSVLRTARRDGAGGMRARLDVCLEDHGEEHRLGRVVHQQVRRGDSAGVSCLQRRLHIQRRRPE